MEGGTKSGKGLWEINKRLRKNEKLQHLKSMSSGTKAWKTTSSDEYQRRG